MTMAFFKGLVCGVVCASIWWGVLLRRQREELTELFSAIADLNNAILDQQKMDQQSTKE